MLEIFYRKEARVIAKSAKQIIRNNLNTDLKD